MDAAAPAPLENKTNVRAEIPAAPAFLRLVFRAGAALSTGFAASSAERLFLTPKRHRVPDRERVALAAAERLSIPFRGGRLAAFRWGRGPAVLLMHGWEGRAGQMAAFAPALVGAGYSAVAFDAPAHGRSPGSLATVPLFAEAIAAASARFGGFRAAIAHSMGAPGIAVALRHFGLELPVAVFVGPPRNPSAWLDAFVGALDLGAPVASRLRARLERRFARYAPTLEDFDIPAYAASFATKLLVLHDEEDREVPFASGEAIARAWPGAALVRTSGLGHRRILREPATVAAATDFVLSRIGVLGSRCRSCGTQPVEICDEEARLCAACALDRELWEREIRRARVRAAA